MCDIYDDTIEEEYEYETCLYYWKIEIVLNNNLCCLCHVIDILDEFIEYCCHIDVSLKKDKGIKENVQVDLKEFEL